MPAGHGYELKLKIVVIPIYCLDIMQIILDICCTCSGNYYYLMDAERRNDFLRKISSVQCALRRGTQKKTKLLLSLLLLLLLLLMFVEGKC
jgi:hypothetical protein